VFGRVRIARDIALVRPSIQEQTQSHHAEISISIEDPVSGVGTGKLAAVAEIERLQAQIAAAQKKIFGASSEKTKGTNPDAEVKPKPKQKGHGPTPQPNLERIEMLPLKLADDVACPACGGELAT
jgi:hypothetical protein